MRHPHGDSDLRYILTTTLQSQCVVSNLEPLREPTRLYVHSDRLNPRKLPSVDTKHSETELAYSQFKQHEGDTERPLVTGRRAD
jgi:hypothetical protein